MSLFDETIAILADLIAFPSVSSTGNGDIIAYLADRLNQCGARVQVMTDDSGHKANLFATIGPDIQGGIVLSGHTDVVPADESDWHGDPFKLRIETGCYYGRGACDMKGFVAACVAMAPRFARAALTMPVHFAFTHDEEVGCVGARRLVGDLRAAGTRPAMAIVGEPTLMDIVEGHKSCNEYTTVFHGKEGHASDPDAGVNAVEFAARFVCALGEAATDLKHRAPDGGRFQPPWTTVQAGRIRGGTARNVIAGHSEVEWEFRAIDTDDAAFVKARVADFCGNVLLPEMRSADGGAAIETRVIGEVEGLEPRVQNRARDLLADITGTTATHVVPFGTEAGLFQSLGVDTVVCGPGSIEQAHKANEFVTRDQLLACLDMLENVKRRLSINP